MELRTYPYIFTGRWDIMARFADFEINGERLPAEFFLDWAKVSVQSSREVCRADVLMTKFPL
jgi:hypothetical protein